MTDKVQIAEDLRAGAAVIREKGWHQGGARDLHTGAVCAIGSTFDVLGLWGHSVHERAHPELRDDLRARTCRHTDAIQALARYLGEDDVAQWNDAPGRTADEVCAAMEKAAAWTEEQA